MEKLNSNFKTETLIRFIIAIIGILSLSVSVDFGWGFILGGVISKEGINLNNKKDWVLLALITGIMLIAIYFLLDVPAVYGYIISTIFYFVLRDIIAFYQRKKK